MKDEIKRELILKIEQVEVAFSDPERRFNHGKKKFVCEEVRPLSDHCALVKFNTTNEKRVLGFFYFLPNLREPEWRFFFPTDAHIQGMSMFPYAKYEVEQQNFPINVFKNESE